ILNQMQINMLQLDIAQSATGNITLFSATDFAYLIFLIIGVVAYTTVPGLASYIVHSHLPNPLNQKITAGAQVVAGAAMGAAGFGGGSGGSMGGSLAGG